MANSKSFVIKKDNRVVAQVNFVGSSRYSNDDEGRKLRSSLAAQHFVYRPDTGELAIYPEDKRFESDESWWEAHIREVAWPDYDIVAKENNKVSS